jgi:hypothetical protein
MDNDIQALRDRLPTLSPRDRDFANSLLTQASGRGLSDKQMYWVCKLGATQTRPDAVKIGDLSGLLRLFENAKKHLKRPAIVISSDAGPLKISVAGSNARQPGTINVATVGSFGECTWYGRIQLTGMFEPSPRDATPAGLIVTITELANDPAKAASNHGRLTGKCCFCNRPLSDERSTAVGYGYTCASHFELPWGSEKTDLLALAS